MSILKIARMGHPVLAGQAAGVAPLLQGAGAAEIRRLVSDMVETLADIGGVGLAGPQVHAPLRVIIFFVPADRAEDGAEAVPMTALLDPTFTPLSPEKVVGWEGCLSIPGLRGAVPRFERIRYRGLSLDGAVIEREASGFHARVVQHEIDHLDGILYPQRMEDLSRLVFEEEWRRHGLDRTPTADREEDLER